MNIVKKIPKLEQIAPVYAVIVLLVYTWSLLLFFWRLPSLLQSSTVGEIGVFFSYMAVVDLLESLLVLMVPVALSIILPAQWFYDQFVVKGSSMVLLCLGSLMFYYDNLPGEILSPRELLLKLLGAALAFFIFMFLIARIGFLERFVREFSNRAVIFLYFWIPVSVISLLVVLVRNIF